MQNLLHCFNVIFAKNTSRTSQRRWVTQTQMDQSKYRLPDSWERCWLQQSHANVVLPKYDLVKNSQNLLIFKRGYYVFINKLMNSAHFMPLCLQRNVFKRIEWMETRSLIVLEVLQKSEPFCVSVAAVRASKHFSQLCGFSCACLNFPYG